MFFKDKVFELFEKELHNRDLYIKSKVEDDTYIVPVNGIELNIYLGNVRRDYKRDKDSKIIETFVDNITKTVPDISNFECIRDNIRFSLESCEFEKDDYISENISETVSKVIVFVSDEERLISWVNKSQLSEWKIEKDELSRIADDNMSKLLDEFDIEVKDINGMRLAMFPLKKVAFKASLITCSKFKDKLSSVLGWPVLTVIPARDFIYSFSVKDKDLLTMVGGVVVKEFSESAYPITKEVLLISDKGIEAVGTY